MEKNKVQKVLFLTNIPSPYRVAFFNELGKVCELTVLYEKETASDRNPKWKSAEVIKNYQEVFLKAIWEKADNGFCPGATHFLKKKLFDIIVVGVYSTPTGMYAIHYMKRKKIPYFISCDGGMVKQDNKYKFWLKRYFLSGAKGYFSPSDSSDEYLIYYGAEKRKIHRYPFTSLRKKDVLEKTLSREEKLEYRRELQMKEEFIILSVGQFIYRKGFDLLLKASAELSAGVYIVGDNVTAEYVELQKQLNLKNVHFIDFQREAELKKYYMAADIFVLPTREDIWGLVVNEAMAAGLPVITTDKCVAGLELIGYGDSGDDNCQKCGKIIKSESVSELEKAIKEYVEMPDWKIKKEAENSLKKIADYTIEKMAESHIKVWEQRR